MAVLVEPAEGPCLCGHDFDEHEATSPRSYFACSVAGCECRSFEEPDLGW